jgi:hypothetical protein
MVARGSIGVGQSVGLTACPAGSREAPAGHNDKLDRPPFVALSAAVETARRAAALTG